MPARKPWTSVWTLERVWCGDLALHLYHYVKENLTHLCEYVSESCARSAAVMTPMPSTLETARYPPQRATHSARVSSVMRGLGGDDGGGGGGASLFGPASAVVEARRAVKRRRAVTGTVECRSVARKNIGFCTMRGPSTTRWGSPTRRWPSIASETMPERASRSERKGDKERGRAAESEVARRHLSTSGYSTSHPGLQRVSVHY